MSLYGLGDKDCAELVKGSKILGGGFAWLVVEGGMMVVQWARNFIYYSTFYSSSIKNAII